MGRKCFHFWLSTPPADSAGCMETRGLLEITCFICFVVLLVGWLVQLLISSRFCIFLKNKPRCRIRSVRQNPKLWYLVQRGRGEDRWLHQKAAAGLMLSHHQQNKLNLALRVSRLTAWSPPLLWRDIFDYSFHICSTRCTILTLFLSVWLRSHITIHV